MNETKETKKLAPPYLSYKTFLNFLEQLKVGVPSRIDHSVMGKFSGTARTQILTTLKYLHLISPDDTSTETLLKLVTSEGIDKKNLRAIIIAAYPFLFKDGIDLKRTTLGQLQDLFEKAGASGGTIRKSIAFFIAAAKDTDINVSPHIRVKSHAGRPKGKKSPLRIKAHEDIDIGEGPQIQSVNIPWQQLLLSKFPGFDPAWPDDVKAKWFDGFKELMAEFKKQSEENKEVKS